MTTVFDAAGEGSAKACWLLMRRAKRTGLSPQALPRNLRSFSQLPVTAPKNRTRIGPHHRRRKMNLFSLKTGYVRRSEVMARRTACGTSRLRAREAIPDLVDQVWRADRRGMAGLGTLRDARDPSHWVSLRFGW